MAAEDADQRGPLPSWGRRGSVHSGPLPPVCILKPVRCLGCNLGAVLAQEESILTMSRAGSARVWLATRMRFWHARRQRDFAQTLQKLGPTRRTSRPAQASAPG